MSELRYWLWLSGAKVSYKAKAAIAKHYGSAEAAFFAPPGEYETLQGVSGNEAAVLEKRDTSYALLIENDCADAGIDIITLQDARYPAALRHIFEPPVVLYVKGKLPPVDDIPAIAVIGTRKSTPYGEKMAKSIACDIVLSGGIVISGLTAGIDAAAAYGALKGGGPCIGVLGGPIEDELSEREADVAAHGALVSEYPPRTRVIKSFFRERNRISAGLAAGVAVIEAPMMSGAMLFAEEATEQGKEIFALPGNADALNSAGTIELLKRGAKPIISGWDVLSDFTARFPGRLHPPARGRKDELMPKEAEPSPIAEKAIDKPKTPEYIDLKELLSGLGEEELAIVTAIDPDGTHVDDIAERSGLTPSRTLSVLTVLEIKKIVTHRPGMRYTLNAAKK